MSVTPVTLTARQAGDLLKCVRYSSMLRDAYEHVNAQHSLPSDGELRGLEQMLLAALERIRDLETRRAAR